MSALKDTVSRGMAGEPLTTAEVLKLLGGVRGIIESFAPPTIFLVIYSVTQSLWASAIAPAGVALLAVLVRLLQRVSVTPAMTGLAGVIICTATMLLTGNPEDYFLPGLIVNILWFLGLAVSIILRWPLIGFVIGFVRGSLTGWRNDQRIRGAAYLATYVWLALFALRLAVQVPLFIADQVTWLGIARVTMGLPLFALVVLFTWLIARGLPARETTEPSEIQPPHPGEN